MDRAQPRPPRPGGVRRRFTCQRKVSLAEAGSRFRAGMSRRRCRRTPMVAVAPAAAFCLHWTVDPPARHRACSIGEQDGQGHEPVGSRLRPPSAGQPPRPPTCGWESGGSALPGDGDLESSQLRAQTPVGAVTERQVWVGCAVKARLVGFRKTDSSRLADGKAKKTASPSRHVTPLTVTSTVAMRGRPEVSSA